MFKTSRGIWERSQYAVWDTEKNGKWEKYIWSHLFNIFINNVSLYINISYADESKPSTSGRSFTLLAEDNFHEMVSRKLYD